MHVIDFVAPRMSENFLFAAVILHDMQTLTYNRAAVNQIVTYVQVFHVNQSDKTGVNIWFFHHAHDFV